MKILSTDKDEFLKRKNQLLEANGQLKKEFIGIDNIIDELINLVEPWYVFPKNNIRPTIINLWGMTGVGKTSLLSRLFEILNHDFVYKFDIGDYVDNGDSKLKYEFSQSVRRIKDGISPVIMFDEFQLGRTVDETGKEIIKSGLRLIWELLDSGKFQMLNENYYTLRIYMYYLKLNEYLSENSCVIENGQVMTNTEEFRKRFGDTTEDLESKEDEPRITGGDVTETKITNNEKGKKEVWAVQPELWWGIRSVWEERFIDEIDVKNHLATMNGKQILDFLNDAVNHVNKPIEKDFSDSLIFVIGNLDQVYGITSEINPDIDADFFHEHTKKIRLSEVKDELLTRYRPEQLSRLGNNQIIYPSLNCDSYRKIIELQLTAFKEDIKEKFDLIVDFDSSVVDIIYNEGVFPTQGVRPVLSSIDNLVKSYFGRIVSDIYINQKDVTEVSWFYDNETSKYTVVFDDTKDTLYTKEYDVVLKTHSLRKSLDNDEQALVATHESGHIIASVYSSNICPKSAFSRTANDAANDAGGFTWIERPEWQTRKLLEEDIVTSLGGYVAETFIFGKENLTPGSISDLDKVSHVAQSMLNDFGMLADNSPSRLGGEFVQTFNGSRVKNLEQMDLLVEKLVSENYQKCKDIITREKTLLLELSKYLNNSSSSIIAIRASP